MLKRGGRAHDSNPEHISATALGALALKCPACPQPGINLPKNWQSEPQEKQLVATSTILDSIHYSYVDS